MTLFLLRRGSFTWSSAPERGATRPTVSRRREISHQPLRKIEKSLFWGAKRTNPILALTRLSHLLLLPCPNPSRVSSHAINQLVNKLHRYLSAFFLQQISTLLSTISTLHSAHKDYTDWWDLQEWLENFGWRIWYSRTLWWLIWSYFFVSFFPPRLSSHVLPCSGLQLWTAQPDLFFLHKTFVYRPTKRHWDLRWFFRKIYLRTFVLK